MVMAVFTGLRQYIRFVQGNDHVFVPPQVLRYSQILSRVVHPKNIGRSYFDEPMMVWTCSGSDDITLDRSSKEENPLFSADALK